MRPSSYDDHIYFLLCCLAANHLAGRPDFDLGGSVGADDQLRASHRLVGPIVRSEYSVDGVAAGYGCARQGFNNHELRHSSCANDDVLGLWEQITGDTRRFIGMVIDSNENFHGGRYPKRGHLKRYSAKTSRLCWIKNVWS